MSLTIFIALCVLGCDVLIYILYQWAFGESRRIREGRAAARRRAEAAKDPHSHLVGRQGRGSGESPVIELEVKRRKTASDSGVTNPHRERLAYRRLAESFTAAKSRS
jgi:hypothetical protein